MDEATIKYVMQFNIDPAAVGEPVGKGTQHQIYAYQGNRLIKFPRQTGLMLEKLSANTIKRDLELVKRYMPGYVARTDILCADGGAYLVMQEALQGSEHLTYGMLPRVRNDLIRIVNGNRQLARQNCLALDLLGGTGYWGCLAALFSRRKQFAFSSNLLVVSQAGQSTIRIVDFNLVSAYTRCAGQDISRWRALGDAWYYQQQRLLLRDCFGVDA